MDPATWIVAVSAALALAAAFPLRRRLHSLMVAALLVVAGAGLGWGGMLLRAHPSDGEFVAAVATLAVMLPAHARIVLGRFGPRRTPEA